MQEIFISDLRRKIAVLYSKTSKTGQKYFNNENIKLVKNIKEKEKQCFIHPYTKK